MDFNFQKYNISSMIKSINILQPLLSEMVQSTSELYHYSKDKATTIYTYSTSKVKNGHQSVMTYSHSVQKYVESLIQKSTHQILSKIENSVGVEEVGSEVAEIMTCKKRIEGILRQVITGHICYYGLEMKKKGIQVLKGKKEQLIPLYASIKATILISKEIILEFIQQRLNNMKVSYEESKDTIVMLISGNFKEEEIRKYIKEHVDSFKRLTVEVVQKGLEIKVDRQSLLTNMDFFSVKLMEGIKAMKEKGEGNIQEVKNKSTNLYKQVIKRIKEKEKQILIQMKALKKE